MRRRKLKNSGIMTLLVLSQSRGWRDLVKLGCARLFIVAYLFIVMQKAEEVLKADSALILKCGAED